MILLTVYLRLKLQVHIILYEKEVLLILVNLIMYP